jgi:hypothetical protein
MNKQVFAQDMFVRTLVSPGSQLLGRNENNQIYSFLHQPRMAGLVRKPELNQWPVMVRLETLLTTTTTTTTTHTSTVLVDVFYNGMCRLVDWICVYSYISACLIVNVFCFMLCDHLAGQPRFSHISLVVLSPKAISRPIIISIRCVYDACAAM